jgi:hypothetical protein
MIRKFLRRHPYALATLAVLVVFALSVRRFLSGQAFPIWDAEGLLAPYHMLIADFARHGRLLWWNPWANAGEPDFMDPQYGAHSPVILVMAWLFGPTLHGFLAYWFAIWLLFGLGVLVLAKRWGVPARGALVVALGLMFSGFFVGHAEHTPVLFSWAWIPLVLWRIEVALEKSSWAAAAQAGVLFGLSALGGYPAVLFTNGVFLAFWIALRVFVREEHKGTRTVWTRKLGLLTATGALVFLIAAVIALPTFFNFFHEGRGFTDRVGTLTRERAVFSNAMHPRALLTFASPFLATSPYSRLWAYTDISSCGWYMGGLVLVFAIFSLLFRPRSGLRWMLVAAAAFALTASLGRDLPVRGWIYDWVPLTRYFRHPSLFRGYTIFLFGVLALLGIRDYVSAAPSANARWRFAGASALAFAAACVAYLGALDWVRPVVHGSADVHFLLAWGGPTLVALGALFDRVARRRDLVLTALVLLAACDAVLGVGLATTLGAEGEERRSRWAEVARERRSEFDLLRLDGANRILQAKDGPYDDRHLLAREAVLRSYSGLRNSIHQEWVKNPILVSAVTTGNRFWFSSEPVRLPPCDEAFRAFVKRTNELGAAPLVVHERSMMIEPRACADGELRRLSQAPAAARIAVTLDRYLPEAMILRLEAPRDGWVLVSDRWAQGWGARVNGEEIPVEGADFLFRGLPVRAGPNLIELSYAPPGYPWAPVAIWFFIALVLGVSWWPSLVRPRHEGRSI